MQKTMRLPVDKETFERLKIVADTTGVTVSELVERIIRARTKAVSS